MLLDGPAGPASDALPPPRDPSRRIRLRRRDEGPVFGGRFRASLSLVSSRMLSENGAEQEGSREKLATGPVLVGPAGMKPATRTRQPKSTLPSSRTFSSGKLCLSERRQSRRSLHELAFDIDSPTEACPRLRARLALALAVGWWTLRAR